MAVIFSKKEWFYGITESIFFGAVIGFSVDNVGLLAYKYACSYESDRKSKTEQAYREMGPVVLHRSVT